MSFVKLHGRVATSQYIARIPEVRDEITSSSRLTLVLLAAVGVSALTVPALPTWLHPRGQACWLP